MNEDNYSIWLIPLGADEEKLSGLITDLSAEFNTDDFDPHVTLHGIITGDEAELIEKVKYLASKLEPIPVAFSSLDYSDDYFRSLFIVANKSAPLMNANKVAQQIFRTNYAYEPHLSLIYGNVLTPNKQEVIRELGHYAAFSFVARSIYLVSLSGEPSEWRIIQEFSIGQ